jgi:hypothetical protein
MTHGYLGKADYRKKTWNQTEINQRMELDLAAPATNTIPVKPKIAPQAAEYSKFAPDSNIRLMAEIQVDNGRVRTPIVRFVFERTDLADLSLPPRRYIRSRRPISGLNANVVS